MVLGVLVILAGVVWISGPRRDRVVEFHDREPDLGRARGAGGGRRGRAQLVGVVSSEAAGGVTAAARRRPAQMQPAASTASQAARTADSTA